MDAKQQKTPKYVTYKNTAYLKQFVNPHGRITANKRSHVGAAHQRVIEQAIKRARFMALMSYVIK